jgi:hypothetical protein
MSTLAGTEHSRYIAKRAVVIVSVQSDHHAFADMQLHVVEH